MTHRESIFNGSIFPLNKQTLLNVRDENELFWNGPCFCEDFLSLKFNYTFKNEGQMTPEQILILKKTTFKTVFKKRITLKVLAQYFLSKLFPGESEEELNDRLQMMLQMLHGEFSDEEGHLQLTDPNLKLFKILCNFICNKVMQKDKYVFQFHASKIMFELLANQKKETVYEVKDRLVNFLIRAFQNYPDIKNNLNVFCVLFTQEEANHYFQNDVEKSIKSNSRNFVAGCQQTLVPRTLVRYENKRWKKIIFSGETLKVNDVCKFLSGLSLDEEYQKTSNDFQNFIGKFQQDQVLTFTPSEKDFLWAIYFLTAFSEGKYIRTNLILKELVYDRYGSKDVEGFQHFIFEPQPPNIGTDEYLELSLGNMIKRENFNPKNEQVSLLYMNWQKETSQYFVKNTEIEWLKQLKSVVPGFISEGEFQTFVQSLCQKHVDEHSILPLELFEFNGSTTATITKEFEQVKEKDPITVKFDDFFVLKHIQPFFSSSRNLIAESESEVLYEIKKIVEGSPVVFSCNGIKRVKGQEYYDSFRIEGQVFRISTNVVKIFITGIEEYTPSDGNFVIKVLKAQDLYIEYGSEDPIKERLCKLCAGNKKDYTEEEQFEFLEKVGIYDEESPASRKRLRDELEPPTHYRQLLRLSQRTFSLKEELVFYLMDVKFWINETTRKKSNLFTKFDDDFLKSLNPFKKNTEALRFLNIVQDSSKRTIAAEWANVWLNTFDKINPEAKIVLPGIQDYKEFLQPEMFQFKLNLSNFEQFFKWSNTRLSEYDRDVLSNAQFHLISLFEINGTVFRPEATVTTESTISSGRTTVDEEYLPTFDDILAANRKGKSIEKNGFGSKSTFGDIAEKLIKQRLETEYEESLDATNFLLLVDKSKESPESTEANELQEFSDLLGEVSEIWAQSTHVAESGEDRGGGAGPAASDAQPKDDTASDAESEDDSFRSDDSSDESEDDSSRSDNSSDESNGSEFADAEGEFASGTSSGEGQATPNNDSGGRYQKYSLVNTKADFEKSESEEDDSSSDAESVSADEESGSKEGGWGFSPEGDVQVKMGIPYRYIDPFLLFGCLVRNSTLKEMFEVDEVENFVDMITNYDSEEKTMYESFYVLHCNVISVESKANVNSKKNQTARQKKLLKNSVFFRKKRSFAIFFENLDQVMKEFISNYPVQAYKYFKIMNAVIATHGVQFFFEENLSPLFPPNMQPIENSGAFLWTIMFKTFFDEGIEHGEYFNRENEISAVDPEELNPYEDVYFYTYNAEGVDDLRKDFLKEADINVLYELEYFNSLDNHFLEHSSSEAYFQRRLDYSKRSEVRPLTTTFDYSMFRLDSESKFDEFEEKVQANTTIIGEYSQEYKRKENSLFKLIFSSRRVTYNSVLEMRIQNPTEFKLRGNILQKKWKALLASFPSYVDQTTVQEKSSRKILQAHIATINADIDMSLNLEPPEKTLWQSYSLFNKSMNIFDRECTPAKIEDFLNQKGEIPEIITLCIDQGLGYSPLGSIIESVIIFCLTRGPTAGPLQTFEYRIREHYYELHPHETEIPVASRLSEDAEKEIYLDNGTIFRKFVFEGYSLELEWNKEKKCYILPKINSNGTRDVVFETSTLINYGATPQIGLFFTQEKWAELQLQSKNTDMTDTQYSLLEMRELENEIIKVTRVQRADFESEEVKEIQRKIVEKQEDLKASIDFMFFVCQPVIQAFKDLIDKKNLEDLILATAKNLKKSFKERTPILKTRAEARKNFTVQQKMHLEASPFKRHSDFLTAASTVRNQILSFFKEIHKSKNTFLFNFFRVFQFLPNELQYTQNEMEKDDLEKRLQILRMHPNGLFVLKTAKVKVFQRRFDLLKEKMKNFKSLTDGKLLHEFLQGYVDDFYKKQSTIQLCNTIKTLVEENNETLVVSLNKFDPKDLDDAGKILEFIQAQLPTDFPTSKFVKDISNFFQQKLIFVQDKLSSEFQSNYPTEYTSNELMSISILNVVFQTMKETFSEDFKKIIEKLQKIYVMILEDMSVFEARSELYIRDLEATKTSLENKLDTLGFASVEDKEGIEKQLELTEDYLKEVHLRLEFLRTLTVKLDADGRVTQFVVASESEPIDDNTQNAVFNFGSDEAKDTQKYYENLKQLPFEDLVLVYNLLTKQKSSTRTSSQETPQKVSEGDPENVEGKKQQLQFEIAIMNSLRQEKTLRALKLISDKNNEDLSKFLKELSNIDYLAIFQRLKIQPPKKETDYEETLMQAVEAFIATESTYVA